MTAPTPALPFPARRELYARLVRREVERLAEAATGRVGERADSPDRQQPQQRDETPPDDRDGA